MKKNLIVLFISCMITVANAQSNISGNATITLLRGVGSTDTVTLKWFPEFLDLNGVANAEMNILQRTGPVATFRFDLAPVGNAAYYHIVAGGKYLMNSTLIEAGDSVTIDVSGTIARFQGIGSTKHWLYYKVDSLFRDWKNRVDTINETLAPGVPRAYAYPSIITNSVYNWRKKIALANHWLDSVKAELSPLTYAWLKADIIGNAQAQQLFAANFFSNNFPKNFPAADKDSIKTLIWKQYLDQRPTLKPQAGIMPAYYITWLMSEMTRTSLPNCREPLKWITSNFHNEWKDRLVAAYLERNGRLLPDSSLAAFDLAISSAHYRNRVSSLLNNIKTGQPAYRFELTGIHGHPVTFQQLQGKLIVLDFWFTGCSGCQAIAPALHRIARYFKADDRICFISVCLDTDRQKWMSSIKSGKYSSSEFIQSLTNGEGFEHPLVKAYSIRSAPSIIIIDQFGNYVSSKLPEYGIDSTGKAYINYLQNILRKSQP